MPKAKAKIGAAPNAPHARLRQSEPLEPEFLKTSLARLGDQNGLRYSNLAAKASFLAFSRRFVM